MKMCWKGIGAVALVGVLAGCGGDSDDDIRAALDLAEPQVRVLHGIRGAVNVDVAVDGEVVLQDVAYQQASGNLDLAPGERAVQVLEACW